MSVIDGESVRAYNKTLNGLDTLGDTEVGDLTVTGDLKVEGASTMEGGLDMTDTKINRSIHDVSQQVNDPSSRIKIHIDKEDKLVGKSIYNSSKEYLNKNK